jgi:hypothetical protein
MSPQWIVIIAAGLIVLLAVFLLGRWRWLEDHPRPESAPDSAARHRAESEGLDIDRPGADDQFATWPSIRVPDKEGDGR